MPMAWCWYAIAMPISKSLEKEKAYARLLEAIIRGDVAVDLPLSERGLSENFGIGRTPVREAIKDMVREGVLETHPTRGTFVRQFTLRDVQEIYQIRYAIEGLAVFLAAEHGPSEALSGYGLGFRKALELPDKTTVPEVYDHGAEFHLEIFRCAGNHNLFEIYRPIRLRFRIALGLPRHRDPQRVFESVREHLKILEAIEARNGELAQKLMCDHLHKGLEARTRMFQSGSTYTPADMTALVGQG